MRVSGFLGYQSRNPSGIHHFLVLYIQLISKSSQFCFQRPPLCLHVCFPGPPQPPDHQPLPSVLTYQTSTWSPCCLSCPMRDRSSHSTGSDLCRTWIRLCGSPVSNSNCFPFYLKQKKKMSLLPCTALCHLGPLLPTDWTLLAPPPFPRRPTFFPPLELVALAPTPCLCCPSVRNPLSPAVHRGASSFILISACNHLLRVLREAFLGVPLKGRQLLSTASPSLCRALVTSWYFLIMFN